MQKKYIIALDQGTTSSRAILFDKGGKIVAVDQMEFEQIFPKPSWVEHDPKVLLDSQLKVLHNLISDSNIDTNEIDSIGITNQRETTVVWNKYTGEPVYNAIVWQDKRTANYCQELKDKNLESYFKEETGLVLDSYFSATKINWILNHSLENREAAKNGDLLFGTIDTWIIWNLTNKKVHATDYSNASRTLLFNINKLEWDQKALEVFDVPENMLPEVKNSSDDFGTFQYEGINIPIRGVAGDQQAALFGQCCFQPGEAKNTYGTGCFMLMNTGSQKIKSKNGLLTTIAWGIDNKVEYALEGSVFIAGAAIQWLRDGLKIIKKSSDSEQLADSITEDNDIIVVPAFAGLGAPYWDMSARGAIFGLTRDSGIAEISKATLDSLAYQTKDVLEAMKEDSLTELKSLNVDGGASANNYLMQFQSDILQSNINRPEVLESTALGAAFLSGIYTGFWSKEELLNIKSKAKSFSPKMDKESAIKKYHLWKKAVKRSMNWVD